MKILFSALAVPFPPTNGQQLRNRALLRALKEEGHDVSLVSFTQTDLPAAENREMKEVCQSVELVRLPFIDNGHGLANGSRLRALVSSWPYGAWRHRSPAMRSAIQDQLRREKFDLIICDDIYNVENLPATIDIPVFLNKHDITHVILRRYLTYERNPLKLGYGWMEYSKLRRWERQACQQSAGVLACSERDVELLRALCPRARFVVVPNVIDVEEYTPAATDDGRTVLYVGALDWLPNQDAVEFFVEKILPSLRQLSPEVRFRVVGRNAPEKFRRRIAAVDGVEFAGAVSDVRTEIVRAAVCVVPLRIGSGTRLKILEAAAMGKPAVSTRIGAEGLNFAEGKEILLADEPDEFAREIASLLASPSRRRALGRAARVCVEEHYSLPVLRGAMRQALVSFVGKPRSI